MGTMITRLNFRSQDCSFPIPGRSIGLPRAKQVAAVLGIACVSLFFGLTTAFAQTTVNVGMTDSLRFEPQEVVIQAGDTVLWTNTGTIAPHTVSAEEGRSHIEGFNSGYFPLFWKFPGGTFRFTFTKPGTYNYFCLLHKGFGMVGKVIVNNTALSPKYFFTAAPIADENQILVRWSVPRNKQRVGFKVLRSTGWDQQFVEVSEGIIKAETETDLGEEFRFVDNNVFGDTQYFYVVKEVQLDGQDSFRGPAIANAR